jgi:hypothetical protein
VVGQRIAFGLYVLRVRSGALIKSSGMDHGCHVVDVETYSSPKELRVGRSMARIANDDSGRALQPS